ncbi:MULTISPECIES: hypothetical protein [unclassified Sinorhizobium]|uniref:hypothetical protein n=1 Tax=unclassified Sinorhizobium TaxID=2613772 RepID=UPI0035243A57
MTVSESAVLDASRFPIILAERSKVVASGIEAMIADFEALLSDGQAFVLSLTGERDAELSHEDQKRWMLWLKENRDRMAASCRGVVSVLDKASDEVLQQKQAAGMQAMLGIPVRLAGSVEEADAIISALIADQHEVSAGQHQDAPPDERAG